MIPIGDSSRSRRTPWVNYAFILANVLVFLYTLTLSVDIAPDSQQAARDFAVQRDSVCYGFQARPTDVDYFYCEWSFQPQEWFDHARGEATTGEGRDWRVLVTIVTAIFLHAGWIHIGGNMLFLWVFGDNVEDRLGHFAYLVFYLIAGVIANLIQGFFDPTNLVPTVGASGAVAGVLGAYIVWFPGATIIAVFPALFFIPLPIPAFLMIGLWFLQNLLAGYATLGSAATPDAGVAWFAHIGGFLYGFLVVFLLLRDVGRRRSAKSARKNLP
ncbi:MAG: rhomboid family intramembrane serine protease [Dehalococcoidia bacterium]|nr:rhomboid family intramembrane serine protease [Dehalococcoidia bacterium]